MNESRDTARLLRWAFVTSLGLLVLRLSLVEKVGFGDSEALYAVYALHPQPAYLDHPGLIGHIARWLGRGGAPSPQAAHVFTALAATLVPWIGALAAHAAGASLRGALRTMLALALVPEIAVGLFGLTPALPLAAAWLVGLALALRAVRAKADSFEALGYTLGAGAAVGIAFMAHVSGVLLGVALLAASLTGPLRQRWRTLAPWGALGVVAILAAPVVVWEARRGWPMLTHRFGHSGFGLLTLLGNLGALVGGQLLYVTPAFVAGAWLTLRSLARQRARPSSEASVAVTSVLFWSAALPGVVLAVLCLVSRVAEPHWLAPAYLALAVEYGRNDSVRRSIVRGAALSGAAIAVLGWLLVATPLVARVSGRGYRARYDLTNDLYAWKDASDMLNRALAQAQAESGRAPVLVGPHWIVCAQIAALVGSEASVGCNGPARDDFDDWLPRAHWFDAPVIVFVTDSRFELDPKNALPRRRVDGAFRLDVRRDGRVVRTLRAVILGKSSDFAFRPAAPRP